MQRINPLVLWSVIVVLIFIVVYLRSEVKRVTVMNERLLVELSNAENLNNLLQANVNYHIAQSESLKTILKPRVIRETIVVRDSIRRIYPSNLSDAAFETRFIPDLLPLHEEYAVSMNYSEHHNGIDFSTSRGRNVLASAAGIIISCYHDKNFGNVVMIDHLNTYKTLYAHLDHFFVEENDFVEKGQRIGLVGNTGNSSNPHLHFQIYLENDPVDPSTIMKINAVKI